MEPEVRFAVAVPGGRSFPSRYPGCMFGDYHRADRHGNTDHRANPVRRQRDRTPIPQVPRLRDARAAGALSRAAHRPRPPGRRPPIRAPASRPDRAFSAGRAGRDGGRPRAAVRRRAGPAVEPAGRIRRNPSRAAARQCRLSRVPGRACARTRRGSRRTSTSSRANWPPTPTMSHCAIGTPTSTTPGFGATADGVLHCGLMDWGCVSQMNLGMALWGAMSGAETDMWDRHLDELLHDIRHRSRALRRPGSRPGPVAPAHPALCGGDGGGLAAGRTGVDPQAIWCVCSGRSHATRASRTTKACVRRCRCCRTC